MNDTVSHPLTAGGDETDASPVCVRNVQCMHVCMYVCVYVCMYVCVCVCSRTGGWLSHVLRSLIAS